MPARAETLSFVDELSVEVEAGEEVTWEALQRVAGGITTGRAGVIGARLLGCEDREPGGPRPFAEGSTTPGFHVEVAEPPRLLVLRGAHRFSKYALSFRLDGLGEDRTRVRAETRADFPGLHGRAYRALVIGTRGHVLATRRILKLIEHRAESG